MFKIMNNKSYTALTLKKGLVQTLSFDFIITKNTPPPPKKKLHMLNQHILFRHKPKCYLMLANIVFSLGFYNLISP